MKKAEALHGDKMIPALITALLLGVFLHGLFELWPSILTEFIAPVNESIWEHVKILFWPLLVVEFLFYPRMHRPGGLVSILIVCLFMLGVAWCYHVPLGGTALAVDVALFGVSIVLYFVLSETLPIPASWMPYVTGICIIMIGLILAFTMTPPHGTLFNDPCLADAWVVLPC